MVIDVQLNFPANSYDRSIAGAFVKDEFGVVFVAHRGKLSKGQAGLRKEKVFREFASRVIEANDKDKTSLLILLSSLDDPDLPERLWQFATEAREVATRISAEAGTDVKDDAGVAVAARGPASNSQSSTSKDPAMQLRDYFDEHSGHGERRGHAGGRRVVEHGDIVRSLENQVRRNGRTQKAQAIDLALLMASKVFLFEVKTSANTQDVYTGTGQLMIHGGCIAEILGKTVERFLVLPALPRPSHGRQLSRLAGVVVVTYAKQDDGYEFQGLPTPG